MNSDGHDELLRFETRVAPVDSPPFVMAIPVIDGTPLLVYNRLKSRWELPGGAVEAGEDPAAAAARELREEMGQQACRVTPLGWAELRCPPDGRLTTAWVFECELEALQPAPSTGETGGIRPWDGSDSPDTDRAAQAVLTRRRMA